MLKEKASALVLTHHLLRKTADRVAHVLFKFATKTFGEESIFTAWNEFWADENNRDPRTSPYLQVFGPWFMYHWIPEEYESELDFPSRHTVVARYLEKNRKNIDNFTKRYLEEARREPLSFWQVEAVEPAKGLLLRDFFTERELFVHELVASTLLKKWDIILGQVIGLDGEYILSGSGPHPLPPSRFRRLISGLAGAIRKGRSGIEPVDLLELDFDFIDCYRDCVEEMFNPVLPEIRNTDGDRLVFTTSRYSFLIEKRQEILSKLNSMRNLDYGGDQGSGMEFVWNIKRKNSAGFQNVTKGQIRVHRDFIQTECNSKARDRRLKDRLIKNLGEWVNHEDTTYRPFDREDAPGPTQQSNSLDLSTLPVEAKEQVERILEQQFMGWVDDKVPALGHIAPREAAKTALGREKVTDLINDWENSYSKAPDQQFQFDFNRLRKELGLEEE